MVNAEQDSGQLIGIRGRVGEWSHGSGLLRVLQRVRRHLRRDVRILAYHRVLPVITPATFDFDLELVSTTAACFRQQMELIRRRFHLLTLDEFVAAMDAGRQVPVDSVVVTFDDGYDDNYRVAFPILRELGIPATFFVSTGHIDSGVPFAYDWLVHMLLRTPAQLLTLPELDLALTIPPDRAGRREVANVVLRRMKSHDDDVQQAVLDSLEREWHMPRQPGTASDCRPMSWDQLREMSAAGMQIGSHGVHHRMLAKLPTPLMEMELAQSKASIERELGVPATVLSYPVGGDRAFDGRVIAATRAAGYQAACSYISGTNSGSPLNRFALHRLPVERTMGIGWFAAMLTLPKLMGYPTVKHIG